MAFPLGRWCHCSHCQPLGLILGCPTPAHTCHAPPLPPLAGCLPPFAPQHSQDLTVPSYPNTFWCFPRLPLWEFPTPPLDFGFSPTPSLSLWYGTDILVYLLIAMPPCRFFIAGHIPRHTALTRPCCLPFALFPHGLLPQQFGRLLTPRTLHGTAVRYAFLLPQHGRLLPHLRRLFDRQFALLPHTPVPCNVPVPSPRSCSRHSSPLR